MHHVNILISILCSIWFWLHIISRKHIQSEIRPIQLIWKIGLVLLPVTVILALTNPSGTLYILTLAIFLSIIGMWTIAAIIIYTHVLLDRYYCQTTVPVDQIV